LLALFFHPELPEGGLRDSLKVSEPLREALATEQAVRAGTDLFPPSNEEVEHRSKVGREAMPNEAVEVVPEEVPEPADDRLQ
jgi:hypothetical protein